MPSCIVARVPGPVSTKLSRPITGQDLDDADIPQKGLSALFGASDSCICCGVIGVIRYWTILFNRSTMDLRYRIKDQNQETREMHPSLAAVTG